MHLKICLQLIVQQGPVCLLMACCPFYQHDLTLIPAWTNNRTHYNVWDEITYPFLNFNGATVEA